MAVETIPAGHEAVNCGLCGANSGWLDRDAREAWKAQHDTECPDPTGWRTLTREQKVALAPRCIHCDRSSIDVRTLPGFIGINYTDGRPGKSGVCCTDCDQRLRAGKSLAEWPPVGATPMRCCGAWEEDENAVDWSSGRGGNGFLHWPGKRCR